MKRLDRIHPVRKTDDDTYSFILAENIYGGILSIVFYLQLYGVTVLLWLCLSARVYQIFSITYSIISKKLLVSLQLSDS